MLVKFGDAISVRLFSSAQPPVTAKKPRDTKIDGYTLTDDYWLREKSTPDAIKHLVSRPS